MNRDGSCIHLILSRTRCTRWCSRFKVALILIMVRVLHLSFSFILTADAYTLFSQYWFTKMPWNDPDQYLKRSPISLVENVTIPTLLSTGEADYRTPISETKQYYQALQLQEVESIMIHIPDACHNIVARPSNMIRKIEHVTTWFNRSGYWCEYV